MSKETDKKETIFYSCPNKCEGAFFYQFGTTTTTSFLDETGEIFDKKYHDFTPDPNGDPIKCRKCDTEAKVGKRAVTTVVEIIEENQCGANASSSE